MPRPWYPFHIADYKRDTQLLDETADLYYRRLLDLHWELQGPIPRDLKILKRLINASSNRTFNRVFNDQLKRFFIEDENGFHNLRMMSEIKKSQEKSKTLAESGRKGGQANAKAKAQAKGVASHNHSINTPFHSAAQSVNSAREEPRQKILAALSQLDFRVEQVHTPKVMGLVNRWAGEGVTPDDIRAVVLAIRNRSAKAFSPAYIEQPLADYLAAGRPKNGSHQQTLATVGKLTVTEAVREIHRDIAEGKF